MIKDFKNNIYMVKYVFKYCPNYVWFSILLIISNLVSSLSKLYVIEMLIDLVLNGKDFIEIIKLLGVYLILILITNGYNTIYWSFISTHYQQVYNTKIQNLVYSKSKNIDYSDFDNPEFYDRYSLTIRMASHRGASVYNQFVNFVNSLVQTIAIGSFIIVNDIYLIFLVVICSVIRVIAMNKDSKMSYLMYKNLEKYQRMYNYVNRTFYQQRFAAEIKTTPVSDLLIETYNNAYSKRNKEYIKTKKKILKWNILGSVSGDFFLQGGTYIYLAIRLLVTKTIELANFTSVLSATTSFSNSFVDILRQANLFKQNSLFIEDFKWYMNYSPTVEMKGKDKLNGEFEKIKVEDVTFVYPNNDHNSITNMNLTINRYEKLAIVGLNGAGKTTLLKLLFKFYNPNKGKIFYNDNDIINVDEKEIRNKYSIVFQDYRIYAISVAENVLMRKYKEEDEEKVYTALEKVGLLDKVLALPKGIHTMVTKEFDPNGLELSGGEAQRLAISRVFASDAEIYVLDEPTSALDPFAEREINKLILEKSKDKTIIIIAHRLSTVVDTDKIILIENGEIVESGNHQELVSKDTRYKKMFDTQAALYLRK